MCLLLPTAHSTAVSVCTLWSSIFFFFFFGFYLSFILIFISPYQEEIREVNQESRAVVGEGDGVNVPIAPTLSFDVVALYFFLFNAAIGDIKVGQLLNPSMRIYAGVCHHPQGKVANKQQDGKQHRTRVKCIVFIRMLSILK